MKRLKSAEYFARQFEAIKNKKARDYYTRRSLRKAVEYIIQEREVERLPLNREIHELWDLRYKLMMAVPTKSRSASRTANKR